MPVVFSEQVDKYAISLVNDFANKFDDIIPTATMNRIVSELVPILSGIMNSNNNIEFEEKKGLLKDYL